MPSIKGSTWDETNFRSKAIQRTHSGLTSPSQFTFQTLEQYSNPASPHHDSCSVVEESVLLAWVLTILRITNDNGASFSWGYNHGGGARCLENLIDGSFLINFNLGNKLQEIRAKISPYVLSGRCLMPAKGFKSIVLADGIDSSLKPENDYANSNSRKSQIHMEVFLLGGDKIWIRPIWDLATKPDFEPVSYGQAFEYIYHLLATQPNATLGDALRLHEWERSYLWRLNEYFPANIRVCMHEIISERAKAFPTHEAICAWDGSLTYGDVEHFSDILARDLVESLPRRNAIVPVCFNKSRWTIVAVLAVMKAGGAFVLMDPSQPLGRLQIIAQEVAATLIITSSSLANLGQNIVPRGRVVPVSETTFFSSKYSDGAVQQILPDVCPSSILYVIFTSGSTGKPKGVVISHETYTSSAIPRAEAVGYHEGSRVLDFASYAFDVSIDSMLCTLMQGGCLCIPSDDDRVNDLNGVIRNMKITMANMTPSVARILDQDVIQSLDALGLGGESVSARDVAIWGFDTRIVIGYGPSECTVGCTINSSAATGRDYVSIGHPTGACLWVVDADDHNRLVPIGAVGELLVEGPIVGQGYLNDPVKTSEVFIEDPTWLVTGDALFGGRRSRLYKTGDLVRYDPDGSGGLVFVGRKDTQVKIRGQRVELGEVEHHVREQLGADFNVIAEVVTRTANSQPSLVAFVSDHVSTNGKHDHVTMPLQQIRPSSRLQNALNGIDSRLGEVLTRYMIPTSYIYINYMPLMVSRKVDRKQLRALAQIKSTQQIDQSHIQSTSSEDVRLAFLRNLWITLLPIPAEEITPQSNFFALGGDSIAAMRMAAHTRGTNYSLDVSNILRFPILSDMSQVLKMVSEDTVKTVPAFALLPSTWDAEQARLEASRYCQVEVTDIEDIYPCTPIQETLMAFSVRSDNVYIAQRIFKIENQESLNKFKAAWDQVVESTPVLRSRIVQFDDHGLKQIVLKEKVNWKLASDLDEYILSDRSDPRRLNDQLCSFAVIASKEIQSQYVVWTIHHALYDGWSTPLILDKLRKVYRGDLITDVPSFTQFIQYISSSDRDLSATYWTKELSGAIHSQFPALPSRNYLPQATGRVHRDIHLHPRSTQTFSLSTFIRGAWALVSSQLSGSRTVIVGETLTGRTVPIPGADQIEGPLITTVPTRIRIPQRSTVQEYLQMIHNEAIERIPHEHVGLQNIRKLSSDAQIACEIKTGLVIQPFQPSKDEELIKGAGVVTSGGGNPAEEALEFNSYPLMLVCSLKSDMFTVYASFDTNLVTTTMMEKVLAQFELAFEQLSSRSESSLNEIDCLTRDDLNDIWQWNHAKPATVDEESGVVALDYDGNTSSQIVPKPFVNWIVQPADSNKLAPVGAIGELVIEGPINSLEFIENPPWLLAGHGAHLGRAGRVYKTGDLVRYSADGDVLLVQARKAGARFGDNMINLDETRQKIKSQVGGVCQVFVDITPATTCHKDGASLLAGITFDLMHDPSETLVAIPELTCSVMSEYLPRNVSIGTLNILITLEQSLRNELPPHMIPSVFVPLVSKNDISKVWDSFVATLNDETESRLREWWQNLRDAAKSIGFAELSATEQLLQTQWSKLLDISPLDIKPADSFFALGGDSIMAMKLVSSVRAAGFSLTVGDVFKRMVLKDMAADLKVLDSSNSAVQVQVPFALLSAANKVEFVQKSIRPLVGYKIANILDVLPVTDAQAMDVLGTISSPRSSVQYNMLYLDKAVDLKRLSNALKLLVHHYDILRTVFVRHENEYLQVVLSELKVAEERCLTTGSISEFCHNLSKSDIEQNEFDLGTSWLKFFLVEGEQENAFMFRISHAQYDGVFLAMLVRQIGAVYRKERLSPQVPFVNFMHHSCGPSKAESITHWRRQLEGADMTHLPMAVGTASSVFISRDIEVLPKPAGVTYATILTTAWAIVLSQSLHLRDVTFGTVTSGRNIPLAQADSIAGPCYSFTPARIQIRPHLTSRELLGAVQNHSVENMPYETLGLTTITKECTNWPRGTQFNSIVHHQDVDYFDEMSLGGSIAKVDYLIPHNEPATPWKVVSFLKKGQVEKNNILMYGIVGGDNCKEALQEKLDMLIEVVGRLSVNPDNAVLDWD